MSGACRRFLEWIPIVKSRGIMCTMLHFHRKFSSGVILYNWKPTPKTCSELLAPSISKCPSPLRLEYPFKGSFIEFS